MSFVTFISVHYSFGTFYRDIFLNYFVVTAFIHEIREHYLILNLRYDWLLGGCRSVT
jgi:hypothetical protein